MAYYGYQYKQQCYIPNGAKCATPVPRQCHNPSAVKSVSYTPCASKGTKLCTVRKTLQSSPKCSTPCLPRCVETRIAEGPSSSCIPRAPAPCTLAFPQPHVQGRGHLCMPHCIQPGITRCPQLCTPAHVYHHSSYPCSYQWSNSYQYNYGPQ